MGDVLYRGYFRQEVLQVEGVVGRSSRGKSDDKYKGKSSDARETKQSRQLSRQWLRGNVMSQKTNVPR